MQNILKACVVAIPITGSISSTSGAAEPVCTVAPPSGIEDVLAASPGANPKYLRYREEIFHPALIDPLLAQGHFEIRDDGSLVRHQTDPEVETVRIGEDFIFMRRASEGNESNILPIPSDLKFVLASLRAIVGQGDSSILSSYSQQLQVIPSGWSLALTTPDAEFDSDRIVVEGCGKRIDAVDLEFQDGNRRRIVFETAS